MNPNINNICSFLTSTAEGHLYLALYHHRMGLLRLWLVSECRITKNTNNDRDWIVIAANQSHSDKTWKSTFIFNIQKNAPLFRMLHSYIERVALLWLVNTFWSGKWLDRTNTAVDKISAAFKITECNFLNTDNKCKI